MAEKRRISKKTIIIPAIAVLLIYLLFFASFPPFGSGYPNENDISEETLSGECPEAVITDYDREFLDKLMADPHFEELSNKTERVCFSVTADEAGLERYAPRPNENYTAKADNNVYAGFNSPSSISIEFEYKGGMYRKSIYLSVDKTESGNTYFKAVDVRRSDGKFIKQYLNFSSRCTKTTYTYGIVGYVKSLLGAMYGC